MSMLTAIRKLVVLLALVVMMLTAGSTQAAVQGVDANQQAKDAAAAAKDAERRSREVPLARDEIELFPELSGTTLLEEPSQERFGKALGEDRFIVRIKQVTNISGNNPWDTLEPLLNFNGVRVTNLAALMALVRGTGATSPLLAGCLRTVPMNVIIANMIWSGNFDMNPSTLACIMQPPGSPSTGSFSIVVDNPTTPANTTYCIGGIPGTNWNPLAGPVCVPYALGTVVTFQALSTAGRLVQVQFRATAGNPPTLQVIAITPLN